MQEVEDILLEGAHKNYAIRYTTNIHEIKNTVDTDETIRAIYGDDYAMRTTMRCVNGYSHIEIVGIGLISFVEGCQSDLLEIVERGRIRENNFVTYMRSIKGYLEIIHSKKLAHFDIKPDNVVICDQYAKIIDYPSYSDSKSFNPASAYSSYLFTKVKTSAEYDQVCFDIMLARLIDMLTLDRFQAQTYALPGLFHYLHGNLQQTIAYYLALDDEIENNRKRRTTHKHGGKATKERVKDAKGVSRIVYIGPKGGRYVKKKGVMVRLRG
jgi:serine/threonine protein kinase